MIQIPIQAVPNQSFSSILDGNTWDFILKSVEGTTVVSLTRNGTSVLESARAAAGSLIIPSQYEESGNFFFVTQNFELPFYTRFNVSQSLLYASAAELAALRAPATPPVRANFFDPIAALPLRFAPRGYLAA